MQIINTGGFDGMSAALYGPPTQQMLGYIQQQYQELSEKLGGYNDAFLGKVQSIVNDITSNEVIQKARSIINQTSSTVRDDIIYDVAYNSLGTTNFVMRNVVMSHPTVQHMYGQGILAGYDGQYMQDDTLEILYNHATNGMTTSDNIIEEDCVIFDDSIDMNLTSDELHSIHTTWRNVVAAIRDDVDPTTQTMERI